MRVGQSGEGSHNMWVGYHSIEEVGEDGVTACMMGSVGLWRKEVCMWLVCGRGGGNCRLGRVWGGAEQMRTWCVCVP